MLKKAILKTIKYYQFFISGYLGRHCRFYPSCSEYGFRAIKKFGLLKGIVLSLWRVLRCNPFSKGGVDPP